MSEAVRKTSKYKLTPTPDQERAWERVLWRCRTRYNCALDTRYNCALDTRYNCALEQRRTWWGRGQGIGATYSQQKAELPDLKAACPEYAEVHSQVLQDVLLRLDRAFHAFHAVFRRLQNGEQPGYPRFQGCTRDNSFTSPP